MGWGGMCFYWIFRRVYFCELFDLHDSYLESRENHGVSYDFVRSDCLYCGLRGAAFLGENCGFCSLCCCV